MHVIVACITDQLFLKFLLTAPDVPYTDLNRQHSY